MKKLALLLAMAMLLMPAAFAKKKVKVIYDHTATMTFHSVKVRNLLDGRSDLYDAGDDYTCTPGDEHHAPDCRKYADWVITEAVSYTEIAFDDETTIVITSSACGAPADCLKREPWDHDKVHTVLRGTFDDQQNPLWEMATNWERGNLLLPVDQWKSLGDREKKNFHYAVLNGDVEIDPIELLHVASR